MRKIFTPDLSIAYSKKKVFLALGITILISALISYLIIPFYKLEESRLFMFFFFGIPVAIIITVINILRGKPVISINEVGIWWKGELGRRNFFVPWDDVKKFEDNNAIFLKRAILVFVEEPEKYLSPKISDRPDERKRISRFGTHIGIPVNFIDEKPEFLMELLNNYHDVLNGKAGANILPLITTW